MDTEDVFPFIQLVRIDSKSSVVSEGEGPAIEEVIDDVADFAPERLQEVFQDEEHILYTMNVEAATKAGAIRRAKGFVRTKNPFNLSRLDTANAEKVAEDGALDTYSVTIGTSR